MAKPSVGETGAGVCTCVGRLVAAVAKELPASSLSEDSHAVLELAPELVPVLELDLGVRLIVEDVDVKPSLAAAHTAVRSAV